MRCPSCNQEVPPDSLFCNRCGTELATTSSTLDSADNNEAYASVVSEDFVGRHREIQELHNMLDEAILGQGQMAMLSGEAGIGKTRTAQELSAIAERQGARVLWGRCHEDHGTPAYWPWIQIIRSYIQQVDEESLSSQMRSAAANISEIVPDLKDIFPELEPSPVLQPEQASFRLLDSITSLFKRISQSQPLVLILDNIHWADKPSLLLLEFLGQELADSHLLVIGTYRDVDLSRRHPLSETLGQLTREHLFHRVNLRGMRQQDVGQFIQKVSGLEPPQEFIELVHSRTEGNPLFVVEVVRMLEDEGNLTTEWINSKNEGSIRLPEGVREVIGRRLNQFSEELNHALTVASVIGREFEFDALAQLIEDDSESQLLESLEEALEAKIIEEAPRAAGQYQFTHSLIRQTLLGELSTTRRVRWHARIAEVLEEIYGEDAESHAERLALHFGEAETVLGTDKLVHYSCLAGEQALAAYANEDALYHFQRALESKNNQPADAETARILFGLGRAQAATLPQNRRDEALVSLGRAFDYYSEKQDVQHAVAVAQHPLFLGTESEGTAGLIERALALVPSNSKDAGRLLSQYGLSLYHETGDNDLAREAFERAMAIARRDGDTALEVQILANSAHVYGDELNLQQCLDESLQAITSARSVDDPRAEVWAHLYAWVPLIAQGNLKDARMHATSMLSSAERLRDRYLLAVALRTNQVVSQVAGDWNVARGFGARGLSLAPFDEFLLGNQMLLEYELGNFAEAEKYLDRLLEVMRMADAGPTYTNAISATAIAKVARIAGLIDELDDAEAAAQSVIVVPRTPPNLALYARIGLGLLTVQRADSTAASELYRVVSELPSLSLPVVGVNTHYLQGLLAQIFGQRELAMGHFEDATNFCLRAGYRVELAWVYYDFAKSLMQRNSPNDKEKAASILDESHNIAMELGMRPLMEKVAFLKGQVESSGSREPTRL